MENHKIAEIFPLMNTEEFAALKKDIEDHGLFEDIITYEGMILDGRNRNKACLELGIEPRYTEFQGEDPLTFVISHNLHRRHLNAFQRAEIVLKLKPDIAVKAKEQQGSRTDILLKSVKSINTQKELAKLANVSPDTIDKVETIVEKATPQQIERINTGESTINKIHTEIKREEKQKKYVQRVEKIKETKEIPTELPNLLLCDPPWRYDFAETKNRQIENQYSTLTVPEMKDHLPTTQDDCILFMWATAPKLREAFELLDLWEYSYKTHAIWDKEIIGSGYWFRGQHELLIVATRGNCSPPIESLRISSVFRERRTKHSKKPLCVYEYIEKAFGDKVKLEMYCREARPGWQAMGNEIE